MKKYLFLALILILSQSFLACERNSYTLVEPEENIGDSTEDRCCYPEIELKDVLFSKRGGIDSVTLKESWYRLTGAFFDKNYYSNGVWSYRCETFYTDSSRIYVIRIECPWFTVERINENTLVISVEENNTGKEREGIVGMQAANSSKDFSIIQSAE